MTLIVVKIVPPAVLAGQSNGQLNPAILADTPGEAGGPRIRLLADTATRAWRAMCAAAPMALQATSSADSYRTYDQQVRTFTDRYQVEPTTNGYRLWDSDGDGVRERWYKKDGVASAAVPGRSNHGWGLAVDVANASGTRLDWLEAHALAYGWSWELVPEEPWHIHYWAGDELPKAVLDYEKGLLDMDLQCLVRYTDDPNPRRVWLCNRMLRREVAEEELVDAGTSATYLAAVIAGTQPATGGVADISGLAGGPLANGGKVFQTNGYTAPRRDTWGVDVATFAGSGLAPSGPVDLSDDALAEVRELVDEELDEQSRAGADTDQ